MAGIRSFIDICVLETGTILTKLASTRFPAKAVLLDTVRNAPDDYVHKLSYTLLDARNTRIFMIERSARLSEPESVAESWLENITLRILDEHPVLKMRCTFLQKGQTLAIATRRP